MLNIAKHDLYSLSCVFNTNQGHKLNAHRCSCTCRKESALDSKESFLFLPGWVAGRCYLQHLRLAVIYRPLNCSHPAFPPLSRLLAPGSWLQTNAEVMPTRRMTECTLLLKIILAGRTRGWTNSALNSSALVHLLL